MRDPAAVRYWLVVTVAALVVATMVGHALDRGEAAQRRWGRTRPVLVADRPIRAGERIAPATRVVDWPVALVPPTALRRARANDRAGADLDDGSPVTASAIGRRTSGSRRTVAVSTDHGTVPVAPGDRVDVWATVDASLAGDGRAATRRVARDAEVVEVEPRQVVVAVRPSEIDAVARATALATVTLTGRR